MDNRNSKIYTEIIYIEVSRVIVVLFSSTEISIKVLKWIIAILNFSTEMSDVKHSRVMLVLYFSTEINIEILRWIITILNFSTEIRNLQLSRVILVLFFQYRNTNVVNLNAIF